MVLTDTTATTLTVPDIGVTLRTLLACAAKGYKTNRKRTWKVMYKNVVIGSVRIKTTFIKDELGDNQTVQGGDTIHSSN